MGEGGPAGQCPCGRVGLHVWAAARMDASPLRVRSPRHAALPTAGLWRMQRPAARMRPHVVEEGLRIRCCVGKAGKGGGSGQR